MWRRQYDDREVDTDRCERGGALGHGLRVAVRAEPHMARDQDFVRIPANGRTVGVEHVALVGELLH